MPDPVLVLAGDPVLVQRRVADVVAQVVTPATRAFNYDVFEAKAAGATAILNAARTVPMLAKQRLVVVRDTETLGQDGLAQVAAYLDDPSPMAVLVLLFGKVDGRFKIFQVAKKKGFLHELETPRQPLPWIREEAARRGARLSDEGARRLAEVVGADLGRLASAIDQLTLYAEDRPISAADVDDLIAETRERTVFELSNAVGQGDRERALRAVARLFDQRESAVGLAMMLARHVRQMALVKEAIAARTPTRDLPRLIGIPPFAVDGLVAQARRFSPQAIDRALLLLGEADRHLKNEMKRALGDRMLVERLVERLLSLAT